MVFGSSDAYKGAMSFDSYMDSVNGVSLSPDGKYVVTGTFDGVKLWDVRTGSILRSFKRFGPSRHLLIRGPARNLSLTPDISTSQFSVLMENTL